MTSMNRPISSQAASNQKNARRGNGQFGHQLHAEGATLTAPGTRGSGFLSNYMKAQENTRWDTLSMDTFRAEQTAESRNNQMQWELAKQLSERNGKDVFSSLDDATVFMAEDPNAAAEMLSDVSHEAGTGFSPENLPVISGGESLNTMEGISRRGDQLWQADLTALYTGAETARANGSVATDDEIRSHSNIVAAVALNQRTAPEVLDNIVDTYLDGDDSFRSHARNSLINANTSEDTLMKALRRSTDSQMNMLASETLERRYEEERPSIFKWAAFRAVEAVSDIKRFARDY